MKFLLVVFILVNGEWTRGDDLEGWGSVAYETEEICLERKARAEKASYRLEKSEPSGARQAICL